jgi:hypothetical protein
MTPTIPFRVHSRYRAERFSKQRISVVIKHEFDSIGEIWKVSAINNSGKVMAFYVHSNYPAAKALRKALFMAGCWPLDHLSALELGVK